MPADLDVTHGHRRTARAALRRGAAAARLSSAAIDSTADVVRTVAALRDGGALPRPRRRRARARPGCARKAAGKFGDFAEPHAVHRGRARAGHAAARRRAARRPFAEAGIDVVADLGCGIGADALALAALDLEVTAVERDEVTAAIAAYNLAPFADRARSSTATPRRSTSPASTAVYLDPAPGATAGHAALERSRRLVPVARLGFGSADAPARPASSSGPGIDRDLIPDDAEAQWVSVDREVVELVLWFGAARPPRHPPLRARARRRRHGGAHRRRPTPTTPRPASSATYLLRARRRRHPGPPDRRSRPQRRRPHARPDDRLITRDDRAADPVRAGVPGASSSFPLDEKR